MTFAYWMLIAAAMLPYLTIALAKSAGGIDNRAPRPSLESLSGWRQRADWAHRNHFEAFPAFAAAVFVAELTHAPQSRIDQLAGIFALLRVIEEIHWHHSTSSSSGKVSMKPGQLQTLRSKVSGHALPHQ